MINQQSTFPPSRRIHIASARQAPQGSDLAYLRAEVITMPQRSNDPGQADPRASVPQEQDDELEMAEDDEDFEDDEEFDSESELERSEERRVGKECRSR